MHDGEPSPHACKLLYDHIRAYEHASEERRLQVHRMVEELVRSGRDHDGSRDGWLPIPLAEWRLSWHAHARAMIRALWATPKDER